MPGDLEIEKKKSKKQTNKQTNKKRKRSSIMDFVIMENEICAASKHVLVVQKMAIPIFIRARAVFQTLDTAIHRINYYPADK